MEKPDACNAVFLGECPFCGYSEAGLPVQHVCPECGREFDRRWRVFGRMLGWRFQSRTHHVVTLIGLGSFVFAGVLILLLDGWDWSSWNCWLSVLMVILGPAAIIRIQQVRTRSRRFVVVDADAMTVVDNRKPETKPCALRDIEQALTDTNEWLILKVDGQEQKVCRFPNGRHEAQARADYFNSQLVRLRTAASLQRGVASPVDA